MQWLKARWIKCGNHPQVLPADEVARQLGPLSLDGVNLYENSILQWAGTQRFCVTECGRIGWLTAGSRGRRHRLRLQGSGDAPLVARTR